MAESLNERIIKTRIGTYKNAYPSPSTTARNRVLGLAIAPPSSRVHLAHLTILEEHQRDQQEQHHDAGHGGRHGPVTIVEELRPHDPSNHQRIGSAEHFRN